MVSWKFAGLADGFCKLGGLIGRFETIFIKNSTVFSWSDYGVNACDKGCEYGVHTYNDGGIYGVNSYNEGCIYGLDAPGLIMS
jgi:hypothetical protein